MGMVCRDIVYRRHVLSGGMNTAVEKLADHVCRDWNENIKIVKDVAAGAVFLMTFACIAVGLIVFLPRLLAL